MFPQNDPQNETEELKEIVSNPRIERNHQQFTEKSSVNYEKRECFYTQLERKSKILFFLKIKNGWKELLN